MANTIEEKIKQQANNLIEDLYGSDVAKIRRQLLAFHANTMNIVSGADSVVDPVLFRLIESKHTTAIVVCIFAIVFTAGYLL